jgi:hypothetical protein
MKKLLYLIIFLIGVGCKKFEEVDFQSKNCIPPKFRIQNISKGNLRYDFFLNTTDNTPIGQAPIRVIWTIEDKTYTGSKVSYQFGSIGVKTINVVFYNACLTDGTDNLDLIVK